MIQRVRKIDHRVNDGDLPKTTYYKLRKLRLWFAWPFVLVLAVYAKSTATGFLVGIPFIIAGEAIRVWAHGYLRKTRHLATDGPYAYVRNPLYLGNFLLGLGFCIIIWHPLIVLIYAGGFMFLYWVTVKGEEDRLSFRFDRNYANYVASVPRFIPRFTPYSKRERARFVGHRVWGHGEIVTILAIGSLLLILLLRQELYQNGQPLSGTTIAGAILSVITAMTLVFTLMDRRRRKRRKRNL